MESLIAFVLLFMLVPALVFSCITGLMANSRGRSVTTGVFCGFFFGPIAIIYYLIAGDSVEVKVWKEETAR